VARTLTAARAVVRAGQEAEYIATLRELARAVRERGARFWAFRSTASPDAFLEFVERSDGSAAARTSEEIAIERRLRKIALYGPDAEELWEEFPCE
jgi:hypothetical protein